MIMAQTRYKAFSFLCFTYSLSFFFHVTTYVCAIRQIINSSLLVISPISQTKLSLDSGTYFIIYL